jgi:hypothetical protein
MKLALIGAPVVASYSLIVLDGPSAEPTYIVFPCIAIEYAVGPPPGIEAKVRLIGAPEIASYSAMPDAVRQNKSVPEMAIPPAPEPLMNEGLRAAPVAVCTSP